MKYSKLFILSFFITVILFLFTSCEKETMNVLPKETQLAKNTFGCMINNQLFIGGGYYSFIGYSPLSAEYNRSSKTLGIFTVSKIYTDKANGSMGLMIANPVEGSTQKLSHATYIVDVPDCYQYLILNEGEVYLTKFDTINKIGITNICRTFVGNNKYSKIETHTPIHWFQNSMPCTITPFIP